MVGFSKMTENENNDLGSIVKLKDASSYQMWKFQLDVVLKAAGIYEIVTGAEERPKPEKTEDLKTYKKKDARGQKYIVTTCDRSVLVRIMSCETSVDMYKKLQESFEKDSSQLRCSLMSEFYAKVIKPDEDIQDQICQLELIVHRIRALGETLSEEMVISKILSSLPQEYSHFYTAWESTEKAQRTLTNLQARLASEQQKMKSDTHLQQGSVFQAKKIVKNKIKCYACNKLGHFARDCYSKKNQACRICKKTNHVENNCFFRDKNQNAKKEASFLCRAEMFNSNSFVIDSGATSHLTNDLSILENVKESNDVFSVANSQKMKSTKVGTVEGQHCELKNVKYVPNLGANLLSVSCITDNDGVVKFTKEKVTVTKNNKVVLEGSKTANGLYVINLNQNHALSVQLLHRKLGHLSLSNMQQLTKMVEGMECPKNLSFCETCTLAKQKRKPFKGTLPKATKLLEIIHTDICGPLDTETHDGKRYFMTILDDYSHYTEVHLLKNKSEAGQVLKNFIMEAENSKQVRVGTVKLDNGLEYKSAYEWLKSKGIVIDVTAPYSPQMNARAERLNYTLCCKIRALLFDSGLDKKMWGEAARTAAYLVNRSPSAGRCLTPIEMWTGRKPDMRKLKLFGSEAFAKNLTYVRKLDERSTKLIFVGYAMNGFRLYDKNKNKIVISRDVVFTDEYAKDVSKENIVSIENFDEESIEDSDEESDEEPDDEEVTTDSVTQTGTDQSSPETGSSDHDENEAAIRRRISTGYSLRGEIRRPEFYDEYETNLTSALGDDVTMLCYKDAVSDEDWLQAIKEEKESLNENKTWSYVDMSEAGKDKILSTKWIFKVKDDGRYKARLVVRGFEQMCDEETYSPVVSSDSLRILLATAAGKNFKMKTFDVKTAFLAGKLNENEKIFIEIPEGFDRKKNKICKLNKCLYGLRQAPLRWNETLTESLKEKGMTQMKSEPCIFVNTKRTIMLAIYVDDGILIYQDEKEASDLMKKLEADFKIKVWNSPTKYAGLQIETDENGLFLHQSEYCNQVLKKYRMSDSVGADTPMLKESNEPSSPNTIFPYREAVGSLLYLSSKTRPDITYAVNYEARSVEKPSEKHVSNVKQTLRYLKKHSDLSIGYKAGGSLNELVVYCDADFANDTETRRSTTGYVMMYNGGPVSWCSRRQPLVTLSSTEAEFVSAAEACKVTLYVKQVIEELNDVKLKIVFKIDNTSAMKLISSNTLNRRTKHIDTRYHFILEKYQKGIFELEHCQSDMQTADLLTKPLHKGKFMEHRNTLLNCRK